MKERLVNVLNDNNTVSPVFPARAGRRNAPRTPRPEARIEREPLKAALAAENITPKGGAKKSRAQMDVSAAARSAPAGDALQTEHEQNMRFEQRIRDRAYFLWQDAGCVENQADDYWHRACALERASTD